MKRPQYRENGKRVYLSRKVMEDWIGRPLKDFESVYHKNHNPNDCRIENLELLTRNECTRRVQEWVSERIQTKMMETFTHIQEVYEACGLEYTMDDYKRHHHGVSRRLLYDEKTTDDRD